MRAALLFAPFWVTVLSGCDKKEPPAPSPAPSGGKMGAVDRALAGGQGGLVDQGKGAIVAQQCAIACGARPGIEPGPCTQTCIKTCAADQDLAAIEACTNRVAAEAPTP